MHGSSILTGRRIVVVRTGLANVASVTAACRRLGLEPEVILDPAAIESAPFVLLPGVGAFGPAMDVLERAGADEALRRRIERDAPTLAICLGLQLLCRSSAESPGRRGLGLLEADVEAFTAPVRLPQLGWNRVEPDPGLHAIEPGHAYFANSFRLAGAPAGWSAAWTEHGERFVAAIGRGSVLACQFHPELSGAWGARVVRAWAEAAALRGNATAGANRC